MTLFERLENIDRKLDSLLKFHTANLDIDDPTTLSEEELRARVDMSIKWPDRGGLQVVQAWKELLRRSEIKNDSH